MLNAVAFFCAFSAVLMASGVQPWAYAGARPEYNHNALDNLAYGNPHPQYYTHGEQASFGNVSGIAFYGDGSHLTGISGAGPGSGADYAFVQDVKPSGTDGGDFIAGSWHTRTLNTVAYDSDSILTLNNNTSVTLPVGSYRITVEAPAYAVDGHKARLVFNDGTTIAYGTSAFSKGGSNVYSVSVIKCHVNVNRACRSIIVKHRCTTNGNTNGLGRASGIGIPEIYTVMEVTRDN